jgi:DNA-binding MarR family transcriptional regulator
MGDELEAAHGMALTSYDVLRQLALATDSRLRMADLADRVVLSRPGLTGIVHRLHAEGLVARQPAPDDRRGSFAVLTDAGRRRLLSAHATHVTSITEHFAAHYTDQELDALALLLERPLSTEGPSR